MNMDIQSVQKAELNTALRQFYGSMQTTEEVYFASQCQCAGSVARPQSSPSPVVEVVMLAEPNKLLNISHHSMLLLISVD